MIKKIAAFFSLFYFSSFHLVAQSYAPGPDEPGTTAIAMDSSVFVAWATGINVQRGYLDITQKQLGYVSFGIPEKALGSAEGNAFDVVSLGDSGVAVLSFEHPIYNGVGPDFAVFENAFADNLLELAFVEVSSNGVDYARFPAVSEIPIDPQLTGFEYSDCRYVNNLAGKYRAGFGTPFDLAEIDHPMVDINNISFVKLIDVIGSVNLINSSFDSNNQIINDPFPTNFESGGFDLDGIGVIHSRNEAAISQLTKPFQLSLNQTQDKLQISCVEYQTFQIFDLTGKLLQKVVFEGVLELDISAMPAGFYFIQDSKNNKGRVLKSN